MNRSLYSCVCIPLCLCENVELCFLAFLRLLHLPTRLSSTDLLLCGRIFLGSLQGKAERRGKEPPCWKELLAREEQNRLEFSHTTRSPLVTRPSSPFSTHAVSSSEETASSLENERKLASLFVNLILILFFPSFALFFPSF